MRFENLFVSLFSDVELMLITNDLTKTNDPSGTFVLEFTNLPVDANGNRPSIEGSFVLNWGSHRPHCHLFDKEKLCQLIASRIAEHQNMACIANVDVVNVILYGTALQNTTPATSTPETAIDRNA